jgi:hypothetical protein
MLVLLGILFFHRQHRLPALVLLVLLIGGGAIFTAKYLTRTATFIQREKSSGMDVGHVELELRGDLWLAAAQMWRENFWWGVGPAHYNYRFPEYRSERVQEQPDRAQNVYLKLLPESGTSDGIIGKLRIDVTRSPYSNIPRRHLPGIARRRIFSAATLACCVHTVENTSFKDGLD